MEEECGCAQLGFVARALEQRCKRSQLLPWGNESYSRRPPPCPRGGGGRRGGCGGRAVGARCRGSLLLPWGNGRFSRRPPPPTPWVGHVSLGSASDWGACLERVGAHRCAQPSCGQRRLSACANDPAANQADQFCVCVFFCFGALSYTLLRRRCVCVCARVCVIHRPVSSHWHSACDPSQSLTRQKNFCAHPL